MFGFIILRHVNNELTNNYWIRCYDSIRRFYPNNEIVIVDDNSNYKFITNKELTNTTIIQSEYPKCGELLPYYYYLKNDWFDTAVIIHDSVFINKLLDLNVEKYKIIWSFEHDWDMDRATIEHLKVFKNKEIIDFYNKKQLWKGCFGAMSIITHNYLAFINSKYDLSKLLPRINTRRNRMMFERIIACLLQKHSDFSVLLGDIHKYCKWGVKYKDMDKLKDKPMIKVWSGR